MEVECVKYRERMDAEQAECRHPGDYCKDRSPCIIHYLGGDKKRNGGAAAAPEEREQRTMVELNFAKGRDGLLPAIVQDHASGEVLMLAYINKEAWQQTLATGKAHFWR